MKLYLVPDWVLPFGKGLTLYKLILVRKSSKRRSYLIAHEVEHVRQWEEAGFFIFPFLYFWELGRVGYWANKYEIQARAEGHKNAHIYGPA